MKLHSMIFSHRTMALLFAIFIAVVSFAQEKEILIIGTMHTVPSIVKHSYRPLLKEAIKYSPDAILTEDILPEDTMSLHAHTPKLCFMADSALKARSVDEKVFNETLKKDLNAMSQSDFELLAHVFLTRKDRANYEYYDYLSKYGVKGSETPGRNESEDLVYPLAIKNNIRILYPIDDQQQSKAYNSAWAKGVRSGATNGDYDIYCSILKKSNRADIVHSLMGRLGKHTNSTKTLNRYYQTNSLRYAEHPNSDTELARQLWDDRNVRMANHVVHWMQATNYRKYILVVGAGHVISLKKALNLSYPDIKVKLLDE